MNAATAKPKKETSSNRAERASRDSAPVPVLGLFEKRIEGDDALLELARLRFEQAHLGAEMHAGTPEILEGLLKFRPRQDTKLVLHLPRDFNLNDVRSRGRILEFATHFAGRLYGMVIHDHPDMVERPDEYLRSALEMEAWFERVRPAPLLFVEYAVGLDPDVFIRFFESVRELSRVTAAIDIGHIGIWQARQTYAARHSGQDVCALKSQPPELPKLMPDVEEAARSALPGVLSVIEALGTLRKPVHFHLHDGHPLSTFSPYGVSDHLSFFEELPLNFEYRGRRSVPPLYGPAGLEKIVATAVEKIGQSRVSFTLEIHPRFKREPLHDASLPLFSHWADKTNAEQMNEWLSVLARNKTLVAETLMRATESRM